ncbi:putative F-box/kelch-repeat protein [Raphanus sativus]|nr:putative F-box/kelch-repeat protein [Raphanus sativus]
MTVANLPNDLESEILARVPAKSLSELKTTCKRWYDLFRDPKFVEKNKKMSGEAARESMLLCNHEVYSIAGDLHNSGDIESSLEFTGKLPLDMYTISHCDGLILCQAENNSSVVVWNPCTGETRMIEPTTCYYNSDRFSLGYDSRGSYKILRWGVYQKEEESVGC